MKKIKLGNELQNISKKKKELHAQIRYYFVHKKGFQLIFRYVQKTFMAYQKLKFNNLNIIRFLYSFCITNLK